MRFSEIIEERYMPLNSVEKVIAAIKEHCQPWLAATKHGHYKVFRGVRNVFEGLPGFIKPTRLDRRPKDTSELKHQMFNLLINHLGGVANRTNSIFVTSSVIDAKVYGEAYMCFPCGEFDYTWSPVLHDWTYNWSWPQIQSFLKMSLIQKDSEENVSYNTELENTVALARDPKNVALDRIRNIIKVNEGLMDAIKIQHEIMIKCDAAIYVNIHDYNTWVQDAI